MIIISLQINFINLVVNDPVAGFKDEAHNLVKSYCERPNTICLIVSNSDMDLACNLGYAMVKVVCLS